MFMALVTSLVVLFHCCATADILTKLLQQYFLIFIVVPWLYLGNSQVSVYRTIGPTLVSIFCTVLGLSKQCRPRSDWSYLSSLVLLEKSDLGLLFLPLCLHFFFKALLYFKASLVNF